MMIDICKEEKKMKITAKFTVSEWENGSGWKYCAPLECNIEDFSVDSWEELKELYPNNEVIKDMLLENRGITDLLDEEVKYEDDPEIIYDYYSDKETDNSYALSFYVLDEYGDYDQDPILRYQFWEYELIMDFYKSNCH